MYDLFLFNGFLLFSRLTFIFSQKHKERKNDKISTCFQVSGHSYWNYLDEGVLFFFLYFSSSREYQSFSKWILCFFFLPCNFCKNDFFFSLIFTVSKAKRNFSCYCSYLNVFSALVLSSSQIILQSTNLPWTSSSCCFFFLLSLNLW